jgi:dTDP-glucose 4,6-dehydratase
MKLIITGSSGFIGSNFSEYCVSKSIFDRVICLDRVPLESVWWFDATKDNLVAESYVTDLRKIDDRLIGIFSEANCVLHLAAITSVDKSIANPTNVYENNTKCLQSVLELCRQFPELKMLYVSTDEVYGEVLHPLQAIESDALKPGNPYSASKASGEMLCEAYKHSYSVPITIIRLGNVFGPKQHPEKLIPRAIGCALAGYNFPLYGDGLNVRSWLFIDDILLAISELLVNFVPNSIYNITSHNNISNKEILNLIANRIDNLNIEVAEDRKGHDLGYSISSSIFRKTKGWMPTTSITTGLDKTIAWYKNRSRTLISETLKTIGENNR